MPAPTSVCTHPSGRTLIQAAMIADGSSTSEAPGCILLEGDSIIAAGPPTSVGSVPGAHIIDCTDSLVIPALVNVHAHLDLTHIGPRPFSGGFPAWANMVRRERCVDNAEIEASVHRGVELSIAGGTALIGDISGAACTVPLQALRESGLRGVSFLEVFGVGSTQPRACARMNEWARTIEHDAGGVKLGLQPHAPYSCGFDVYRAAADLGLPIATHLAETLDELRFIRDGDGDGPIADMLRSIGVRDDSIRGSGQHPIDLLAEVLSRTPCIAAHLNYVDDRHIPLMANWPITVAYCPRASAYFSHPFEGHVPHRYRDMLAGGVNVALGTDSIICLDTPDRLSVLDDMRLLWRRDGTDFQTLLRMATINGARGLGFDEEPFTLRPGPCAGLLALACGEARSPIAATPANRVAIIEQVMRSDLPPRWVFIPKVCSNLVGRDG